MELPNNNVLSAIDARFLPPEQMDWLPDVRYASLAVGAIVAVVVIWLESRAGVHLTANAIIFTAVVVVTATKTYMYFVDRERPPFSVAVGFWHEISTPRRPAPVGATISMRPPRRVERGRL